MKKTRTHIECLDHLRESEIVLSKHFQWLELLVIRPVLEFQRNHIVARTTLRQLESNSRGIVGWIGYRSYKQSAEESASSSHQSQISRGWSP